jgi:hypothetical protein
MAPATLQGLFMNFAALRVIRVIFGRFARISAYPPTAPEEQTSSNRRFGPGPALKPLRRRTMPDAFGGQ